MIARNDTGDFLIPKPGAWKIRTLSGSKYMVAQDSAGQWWLAGRNIPNAFSCPMPSGVWRIEPPTPWPPIIGERLLLQAPMLMAMDNPERIPGGGKHTSPVVEVELVPPDPEERDDSDALQWPPE